MQLIRPGIAGTVESGDILIEIKKNEAPGVAIELESVVANQFGGKIREAITKALAELDVTNVAVYAVDKGALDCTIRARVTAAALRGLGREEYAWKGGE